VSNYLLPVILHARFSHERLLAMVSEAGITRAVFHWFSGPRDLPDTLAALSSLKETPADEVARITSKTPVVSLISDRSHVKR